LQIIFNLKKVFYYSVEKYTLVVCPSTLGTLEKRKLTDMIESFGGQISRNWSEECTHLCMNSVTVTEKVNLLYLPN